VEKGCVLAAGVEIGEATTIPQFTRLTTVASVRENEDETAASSDVILGGITKGRSILHVV
jgi:hypothetical protein